ncbi:MAG: D-hexose-6-phosphate mutarotase, partial [Comamonadaceae bacterium]
GFARTQPWSLASDTAAAETGTEGGADADTDAVAEAGLILTSTPTTRALWPHEFDARLTVRLESGSLRLTFEVANTGTDAFPFALALHTYLRTPDVGQTLLTGLEGLHYWDAVAHLQQPDVRQLQPAAPVGFGGETDRVYAGVARPLTMSAPGAVLTVRQSASLPDAVVWNPGADRCAQLEDMPPDGWRHMVCAEAACINQPVTLLPGTSWQGWQELRVG